MNGNENSEKKKQINNFTLEQYQNAMKGMIATNEGNYDVDYLNWDKNIYNKNYTIEEIENIINNGSLLKKRNLSQYFFKTNGIYEQFISYYATLLKYIGIVFPNPQYNKSLQDSALQKRYYGAINFVQNIQLQEIGERIGYHVLIDGVYYGLIQSVTKENFVLMDLPYAYCRSRFKDESNRQILEFNVQYFDSITNEEDRDAALKTYPKAISSYYNRWRNGKHNVLDSWMFVSTDIGIVLNLYNAQPYFLSVIPSLLQYDQSINNELKREINEIKKILVNKIPHLNDGTLLFEPVEAQEFHNGIVGMLKDKNPEVSVMTTYGDAEMFNSKTNEALSDNSINNMLKNIYTNTGVSSEIFAASGSSSLKTSIKQDIALMMVLGNKIQNIITNIINKNFANGAINFRYKLLPISYQNEEDYIKLTLDLANSGYSLLMPAVAMGIGQNELINLKTLENKVLKLNELLVPLSNAFTSSGSNSNEVGRPNLDDSNKSEKTIENIKSKEKTGNG